MPQDNEDLVLRDQVAAQEHPDFMNRVTPKFDEPVANLGTGDFNVDKGNQPVLQAGPNSAQSFMDGLYQANSRPDNPYQGKQFSVADVTQPRYPEYMPGADNEEAYAK